MKLTLVEQLNASFPGLQARTDLALDAGINTEKISTLLLKTFKIHIAPRTIRSYRARRWKIERRALARHQREINLIHKLIATYGTENTELYLKLLHLKRTLRRTDPLKLLRELRAAREHHWQKFLLETKDSHPKQ